jgi:hypothetical protein
MQQQGLRGQHGVPQEEEEEEEEGVTRVTQAATLQGREKTARKGETPPPQTSCRKS